MKSSKTHFTVTPLEFVRNLGIEINADKVNGGVDDIKKINDKDKDLSVSFGLLSLLRILADSLFALRMIPKNVSVVQHDSF